jgi:hypothetical protein
MAVTTKAAVKMPTLRDHLAIILSFIWCSDAGFWVLRMDRF